MLLNFMASLTAPKAEKTSSANISENSNSKQLLDSSKDANISTKTFRSTIEENLRSDDRGVGRDDIKEYSGGNSESVDRESTEERSSCLDAEENNHFERQTELVSKDVEDLDENADKEKVFSEKEDLLEDENETLDESLADESLLQEEIVEQANKILEAAVPMLKVAESVAEETKVEDSAAQEVKDEVGSKPVKVQAGEMSDSLSVDKSSVVKADVEQVEQAEVKASEVNAESDEVALIRDNVVAAKVVKDVVDINEDVPVKVMSEEKEGVSSGEGNRVELREIKDVGPKGIIESPVKREEPVSSELLAEKQVLDEEVFDKAEVNIARHAEIRQSGAEKQEQDSTNVEIGSPNVSPEEVKDVVGNLSQDVSEDNLQHDFKSPEQQMSVKDAFAELGSVSGLKSASTSSAPSPVLETFEGTLENAVSRAERLKEVVQKFDEHLLQAISNKDKSVTINLTPPNLGKIVLRCREEAGELMLEMVADNKYVRSIISSQEEVIRDAVEDSGYKMSYFDVKTKSDDSGKKQQGKHQVKRKDGLRKDVAIDESEVVASDPLYLNSNSSMKEGLWLVA